MKTMLTRVSEAAAVVLLWAGLWAAAGTIKRAGVDTQAALPWIGPDLGVLPGLVAGIVFCVSVLVTSSGRRLAALPLLHACACGAIVGLALGVLPVAINAPPSAPPMWEIAVVMIGSMTAMGTLSAAASLWLVRRLRAPDRRVPVA